MLSLLENEKISTLFVQFALGSWNGLALCIIRRQKSFMPQDKAFFQIRGNYIFPVSPRKHVLDTHEYPQQRNKKVDLVIQMPFLSRAF